MPRPRSALGALLATAVLTMTGLGTTAVSVVSAAPASAAAHKRVTKHHHKHKHKRRAVHRVHKVLTHRATGAGLTTGGGGEIGWSTPTGTKTAANPTGATVSGIDVARYQGSVDWASYFAQGKRFAYVKATEGSSYTSPTFSAQYAGAAQAGLVRGAYHFANPSGASGATQAQWFVAHGGAWSADAKTLPGVLDIEYNPYSGGTCYGLSQSAMRSWISSFTTTYRTLTGRDAVIYSTTDWWRTCTGNTSAFAATNPLWIARYNSSPGTLPAGWAYWSFWQYSSSPLDQDRFNGTLSQLKTLATG